MKNRDARHLKSLVNRRGELYTHLGKSPEYIARMVELDRNAMPGMYPLAYISGVDGIGYICQPCAQEELEEDGVWPDGFEPIEGGPEDYGGHDVDCAKCGELIVEWEHDEEDLTL